MSAGNGEAGRERRKKFSGDETTAPGCPVAAVVSENLFSNALVFHQENGSNNSNCLTRFQ